MSLFRLLREVGKAVRVLESRAATVLEVVHPGPAELQQRWQADARARAAAAVETALDRFRDWPETARVAARTGAYIAALGLAVLLAPGATFGLLFDASRVPAGWVRVGGVLAALYGFYYIGAALDDAEGRHPRRFYAATVAGRLALSAAFAGLVALRQCEPGLLLLAAANAASSALLWAAARRRASVGGDAG